MDMPMPVATQPYLDRRPNGNAHDPEVGSADFYAALPVLDDFAAVVRSEGYRPLPDDWLVAVSDVRGSTAAVRQGRYKEVNLIGASTIMAILNVARPIAIPYVFGGDGASL